MTKPRNNSNEQYLRKLEKLRDDATIIRVSHNKAGATGVIQEIFVGRYKLFAQVGGTIFPMDLATLHLESTTPPVKEEPVDLHYDALPGINALREVVGLEPKVRKCNPCSGKVDGPNGCPIDCIHNEYF